MEEMSILAEGFVIIDTVPENDMQTIAYIRRTSTLGDVIRLQAIAKNNIATQESPTGR